jgi:hypothetical protein
MDGSMLINDQLQSGVTFAPADVLYTSTTGYVTTSGNGTGSNSPKIGWAISQAAAGDPNRKLTMWFIPSPRY